MNELGNPLRAYRADRKLSVMDLADAIDLSRAEMVAIEDGRRTITREQRDLIAQRLDVDPEKLTYLMRAVAP